MTISIKHLELLETLYKKLLHLENSYNTIEERFNPGIGSRNTDKVVYDLLRVMKQYLEEEIKIYKVEHLIPVGDH